MRPCARPVPSSGPARSRCPPIGARSSTATARNWPSRSPPRRSASTRSWSPTPRARSACWTSCSCSRPRRSRPSGPSSRAKQKGFVYVRRQVDASIGEQLADLELVGVNVDREDRRVLPGGETGRSVIGRTDIDGNGTAGLELQYGGGDPGTELGYDDILTGTPGVLTREVAPQGRSIPGSEEVTVPPVPGQDIVLTIDRSIQFADGAGVARSRQRARGARPAMSIVMGTHTGEVLAMSSVRAQRRRGRRDHERQLRRRQRLRARIGRQGGHGGRRSQPGLGQPRFDVRRPVAAAVRRRPAQRLAPAPGRPHDRRADPRRVVEHRHDRHPGVARVRRLGRGSSDALGVPAQLRFRRSARP